MFCERVRERKRNTCVREGEIGRDREIGRERECVCLREREREREGERERERERESTKEIRVDNQLLVFSFLQRTNKSL